MNKVKYIIESNALLFMTELDLFKYTLDDKYVMNKNKGASPCHRKTLFHKEPSTSEKPFCVTKGSEKWFF